MRITNRKVKTECNDWEIKLEEPRLTNGIGNKYSEQRGKAEDI
jgi:hypothetical protein